MWGTEKNRWDFVLITSKNLLNIAFSDKYLIKKIIKRRNLLVTLQKVHEKKR